MQGTKTTITMHSTVVKVNPSFFTISIYTLNVSTSILYHKVYTIGNNQKFKTKAAWNLLLTTV